MAADAYRGQIAKAEPDTKPVKTVEPAEPAVEAVQHQGALAQHSGTS